MNHLRIRAAALAVVAIGCLTAAHAESFTETRARLACQIATNKTPQDQNLEPTVRDAMKDAVIKMCVASELVRALKYKQSMMPKYISIRCTVESTGSLAGANECMDNALAGISLGTINGIWQFQKDGKTSVFWTFDDCRLARETEGGGVCINNN